MASTSASNQSISTTAAAAPITTAEQKNTPSSSYFQKTVCLQDWWLIKAEMDFEGKSLAVAGLSSRDCRQQAVREFFSAAILKRYDVFTVETVDGICVVLKGFINKVRTIESGFPSEVFNHFVFGFPPYWEEYAEKCLGKGFINKDASRNTSGVDEFSEGTPNRHKAHVREERHGNSNELDLSSEDDGNVLPTKGQHKLQDGARNESSAEDPMICSSQVGSETIIGGASKGFHSQSRVTDSFSGGEAGFHVNLCSGVSMGRNEDTIGRYPCGEGEKRIRVESENIGSENIVVLDDNMNLHDATTKSPLPKSSDVYSAYRCKFKKAVSMETSDMNPKSSDKRSDSLKRNVKISLRPEVLTTCTDGNLSVVGGSTSSTFGPRETQKESLPVVSVVECTKVSEISKKLVDDSMKCPKPLLSTEDNIGTPANVDMNISPSTTSFGRRLDSMLKYLRRHQNINCGPTLDAHADLDKEKLNSISPVGTASSVGKRDILEEGSPSEGRMCNPSNSKSKLKDDQSIFSPVGIVIQPTDYETEQICIDIRSQATKQSKSKNKTVRSSIGFRSAKQTDDLKITGSNKEVEHVGKASKSSEQTKRKLTFESPVSQGGTEKTSFVLPESLSYKRSRSGRLLLPALEFWRNQMAIYDADRQITGIQESLCDVEPSRGSRPGHRRKQR